MTRLSRVLAPAVIAAALVTATPTAASARPVVEEPQYCDTHVAKACQTRQANIVDKAIAAARIGLSPIFPGLR